MTDRAAWFVVHGPEHLRAALAAGAATGRDIVAISGPGASAYAGAAWFVALARQGAGEFPGVTLTAILDCGDRAGDVLAAFKAGAAHVIFTGHADAAKRLAAIALETSATILSERPQALDLLYSRDPAYAAKRLCDSVAV